MFYTAYPTTVDFKVYVGIKDYGASGIFMDLYKI
jgi:hypothetical protein